MTVKQLMEEGQERDLFRMVGWLLMGLVFYGASMAVPAQESQLQILFWKLGNVTMFSFLGYWIARRCFGRLQALGRIDTVPEALVYASKVLARGLVMVGALGVAR